MSSRRIGMVVRTDELPSTWFVLACKSSCRETWTVDVADFTPCLTADDIERVLTPVMLEHEQLCEAWT